MKQFAAINKIDEELRMVWGYCSTETVDAQGEVVTKAAMQDAWDDYMQFANVREMHQPSAVGVVKEYAFDDTGVYIGVKVVDDTAWNKVVEGVYKGFSIGGKKAPGGYDPVNKIISKMKLNEISLVDRPANPEALIEVFKGDIDQMENDMDPKLAALIAKGLTVEQIVALGEAELAKSATPPTTPEPAPPKEKPLLRKSIAVLKDSDEIAKGLYTVADFAQLIQSLRWLQSCTADEAAWEGDGSTIPGQIAACVKTLGGLLVQMAQEEVAELVTDMGADTDGLVVLAQVIENADKGGDLKKMNDVLDVIKAGKRNSSADQDRIQKAHDLLGELGAACKGDDMGKVAKCAGGDHTHTEPVAPAATTEPAPVVTPTDPAAEPAAPVSKVDAGGDDLQKALGMVQDLTKRFDELAGKHDTLQKAHAELTEKFNKTPQQPKGALMAVAKGQDTTPDGTQTPTVAPVLKMDGTVDEATTMIKQIHASGGSLPFGR